MGLWSKLIRWRQNGDVLAESDVAAPRSPDAETNTVELPIEPFVFECHECGKVFEARRIRPGCPECDSRDVALLSGG
jgi:Zn finger protein HypA/HybF involved in hydrogenase expression